MTTTRLKLGAGTVATLRKCVKEAGSEPAGMSKEQLVRFVLDDTIKQAREEEATLLTQWSATVAAFFQAAVHTEVPEAAAAIKEMQASVTGVPAGTFVQLKPEMEKKNAQIDEKVFGMASDIAAQIAKKKSKDHNEHLALFKTPKAGRQGRDMTSALKHLYVKTEDEEGFRALVLELRGEIRANPPSAVMPMVGACMGSLKLTGTGELDSDSQQPHHKFNIMAMPQRSMTTQLLTYSALGWMVPVLPPGSDEVPSMIPVRENMAISVKDKTGHEVELNHILLKANPEYNIPEGADHFELNRNAFPEEAQPRKPPKRKVAEGTEKTEKRLAKKPKGEGPGEGSDAEDDENPAIANMLTALAKHVLA